MHESDDFYRDSDRLGVMVWQDFLFACTAYPDEPPFDRFVKAKAATRSPASPAREPGAVKREQRDHLGLLRLGQGRAPVERGGAGAQLGLGFCLDLLPRVLTELDPSRPYWLGSPHSGGMEIHPDDDQHGSKQLWDAQTENDSTVYRTYVPRFVAEFGNQAPPTYAIEVRVDRITIASREQLLTRATVHSAL